MKLPIDSAIVTKIEASLDLSSDYIDLQKFVDVVSS